MPSWGDLDDGILRGYLLRSEHPCGICGKKTVVLSLRGVELPEGMTYAATILKILPEKRSRYIGVGCGCYARVHRQIAHIKDSIEEGARFDGVNHP